MYSVLEKKLQSKGINAHKMCLDTGIAQSTISDWKHGRSKPKVDKLLKIAEYLDCDVKEFIAK